MMSTVRVTWPLNCSWLEDVLLILHKTMKQDNIVIRFWEFVSLWKHVMKVCIIVLISWPLIVVALSPFKVKPKVRNYQHPSVLFRINSHVIKTQNQNQNHNHNVTISWLTPLIAPYLCFCFLVLITSVLYVFILFFKRFNQCVDRRLWFRVTSKQDLFVLSPMTWQRSSCLIRSKWARVYYKPKLEKYDWTIIKKLQAFY